MTLYHFSEQVAWFPPEKMWGAAVEGRPTRPAQSGHVGRVLEQRQAEEGRRQSLGLGTETPVALPPPRPPTHTHTHRISGWSLICRQPAAASYLENILPDVFSNFGKSLNLSGKLKRQDLWYIAAAWKTVFLFSAVRVGGNFSTCIITEDISGRDCLRNWSKLKMPPRPKALVDFEFFKEWKGIGSNGPFVSLVLQVWMRMFTSIGKARS